MYRPVRKMWRKYFKWFQIASHTPRRLIVSSTLPDVQISDCNYGDFLLSNVHKHEKKIALVDGITGNSYRYSELLDIVRRLSSGLNKQNVGKGDVICLFATNCPEYVFLKCAILATGATVTAANPAYSANELVNLLKDSRARIIVTLPSLVNTAKEAAVATNTVQDIYVIGERSHGCLLFEDTLLADDGRASTLGQVSVNGHEDVAMMPYSSGTTGLPKGVELTHRNLCANLAQTRAVKKVSEGREVMLASLPFYHIYGMNVIMANSIMNGGKLITLPRFQPDTYLNAIEQHKVSYLHAVPPQILFFLNYPDVDKYNLSSVIQIMCGAASLDRKVEKTFLETFSARHNRNVDLIQGYGLSETSPMTHLVPSKEKRLPNKIGSVGIGLPNQQFKIISPETREELGPNEEGELLIKGPNVMKGYLRKPKATQESITDGWYHTGDLLRYDEDGYFYIMDRIKELIKYKGIQVAPAEIEALLLTHPQIADCGVIGKPDELAGELPTAFVVTKGEISTSAIQDFVAEHLSNHNQLRGGVYLVDSIPRTGSGKIMRKDLRKVI